MQALKLLSDTNQDQKPEEKHSSESTPVTTKSLANDGGLEDLLKKIGGISLDAPLVTLGAKGQPFSTPLERVDNNPQVFLGTQHQPQSKKEGETNLCLFLTLYVLRRTMAPLRTSKKLVGLLMHELSYVLPEASQN